MQNLDDFVEKILVDKGVTDIEPEIRDELKEDMKKRLLDEINRAASMQLSEEQAADLEAKLAEADFTNEDMVKFVEDAGVDLTKVAVDTMLRFRGMYLGAEA